MRCPRLVYAGNRQLGLRCLQLLLEADWQPCALLVADGRSAECAGDMCRLLPDVTALRGKVFRAPEGLAAIRDLNPDYILSVHFPYIVPEEVLAVPSVGTLNLHPAYLPYNRGWHTPSWAILEGTDYGATLHWMDAGIDTGDLAMQKRIGVRPDDTADRLYRRVLDAEYELMKEAIPLMRRNALPNTPQMSSGTSHVKTDLKAVQHLDLDQEQSIRQTLDVLRALTTNDITEAARFVVDGETYSVRVDISPA